MGILARNLLQSHPSGSRNLIADSFVSCRRRYQQADWQSATHGKKANGMAPFRGHARVYHLVLVSFFAVLGLTFAVRECIDSSHQSQLLSLTEGRQAQVASTWDHASPAHSRSICFEELSCHPPQLDNPLPIALRGKTQVAHSAGV